MSGEDEEVVILEKFAFRQRRLRLSQAGLFVLTNKQLIFTRVNTFYVGAPKKDVVMELKNIVDVGETGLSKKLWIKLGDGHVERFSMQGRDEFLDEVKFALRGDLMTTESIPSSLLDTEDLTVPKHSIPQKYPGALVRLQKTYLTPKICCMCSEPALDKTITAKSFARYKRLKQSAPEIQANVQTPFTFPFPICTSCFRVYRRAKTAGSLGGILGLFVGGVIFVLLLFSGRLLGILAFLAEFVDALGVAPVGGILLFLLLIALTFVILTGLGWGIANVLAVSFALRPVSKERKAFFKVVAEDKGIRVIRRPGFVAFGFLSKEFATVFQQMNGGVATAVGTSAGGNEGIRKLKEP